MKKIFQKRKTACPNQLVQKCQEQSGPRLDQKFLHGELRKLFKNKNNSSRKKKVFQNRRKLSKNGRNISKLKKIEEVLQNRKSSLKNVNRYSDYIEKMVKSSVSCQKFRIRNFLPTN